MLRNRVLSLFEQCNTYAESNDATRLRVLGKPTLPSVTTFQSLR